MQVVQQWTGGDGRLQRHSHTTVATPNKCHHLQQEPSTWLQVPIKSQGVASTTHLGHANLQAAYIEWRPAVILPSMPQTTYTVCKNASTSSCMGCASTIAGPHTTLLPAATQRQRWWQYPGWIIQTSPCDILTENTVTCELLARLWESWGGALAPRTEGFHNEPTLFSKALEGVSCKKTGKSALTCQPPQVKQTAEIMAPLLVSSSHFTRQVFNIH